MACRGILRSRAPRTVATLHSQGDTQDTVLDDAESQTGIAACRICRFRIAARGMSCEALAEVSVILEFENTGEPDIRNDKDAPGKAKLIQNGQQNGSVDTAVTVPLISSAEGMSLGGTMKTASRSLSAGHRWI